VDELHDDPTTLVRTFSAELTPGEGRTADVRIVPYGERARVADGLGGQARGVEYEEEWMPGVFDHQLSAAHRVVANIEHERGIGGIVAKGVTLHEARDGFHGSFRFLDTPNGNTALELVRDKTFDNISLEARPVRSVRGAGGVVRRVKANLMGIAFCRYPAFAGANVIGLREGEAAESEFVWDESLLLPASDTSVLARAAALGIALPDGLADQVATIVVRAFTTEPWDGSASNYSSTAAYCEACLIDDNPTGTSKVENLCHLPIKEEDGDINVNAVRDALSRVDQVETSPAKRAAATKRLQALLAQFNKSGDAPENDAEPK
jgi:HK97 family phage prohead protease